MGKTSAVNSLDSTVTLYRWTETLTCKLWFNFSKMDQQVDTMLWYDCESGFELWIVNEA